MAPMGLVMVACEDSPLSQSEAGSGTRLTNQRRGCGPSVVSSRHCNNYYSRLSGPITPHYPDLDQTRRLRLNLSYSV